MAPTGILCARERCGSTSCHNRKMLSACVCCWWQCALCSVVIWPQQYKITQKHTAALAAATHTWNNNNAHTHNMCTKKLDRWDRCGWLAALDLCAAAEQGNNGRSRARWKNTYDVRASPTLRTRSGSRSAHDSCEIKLILSAGPMDAPFDALSPATSASAPVILS